MRELRDGDQDYPTKNNLEDCQTTLLERVTEDIPLRRATGIERYGTPLQPLNGRDAGRDAYEEWLDLGAYLEQLRREQDAMLSLLDDIAHRRIDPDHARTQAVALVAAIRRD